MFVIDFFDSLIGSVVYSLDLFYHQNQGRFDILGIMGAVILTLYGPGWALQFIYWSYKHTWHFAKQVTGFAAWDSEPNWPEEWKKTS